MKHLSNFDIVKVLESEIFEERHPRETLPCWLPRCMVYCAGKERKRNLWNVKRILFRKVKLKPNQYWQECENECPRLIEVDPVTDREQVLLDDGPGEYDLIFEVEVDLSNRNVSVLHDTDFEMLEEAEYQQIWGTAPKISE